MEYTNLTLGLSLSMLAGLLLGTFAWPMKKIKKWYWENIWVLYSFWALLILPWIWAFLTVPDFLSIYGSVPLSVLITVFCFGAGWGVACVSFGIGLDKLGLALGTAIVLGLNNALGAILPILIYHPEEWHTPKGTGITTGVMIMLIGIVICAIAGAKKEQAVNKSTINEKKNKNFSKGLIICIVSGVLGAMFNFALIAGKPMEVLAVQNGASSLNAANPTWCISLLGGFMVTIGYCSYLFRKNKSAALFIKPGAGIFWFLTFLMGIMWFGGVALYGTAVTQLGKLGASIGWPVIQSMAVASGNVAGIISGEWKGTGKLPLTIMIIGLVLLFVGISVISRVIS